MMGECFIVGVLGEFGGALRGGTFVQRTKELQNEEQGAVQAKKSASEIPRIGFDQSANRFEVDARLNRLEVRLALRSIAVDEGLQNRQLVHHVVFDELEDPTELIDESETTTKINDENERRASSLEQFSITIDVILSSKGRLFIVSVSECRHEGVINPVDIEGVVRRSSRFRFGWRGSVVAERGDLHSSRSLGRVHRRNRQILFVSLRVVMTPSFDR